MMLNRFSDILSRKQAELIAYLIIIRNRLRKTCRERDTHAHIDAFFLFFSSHVKLDEDFNEKKRLIQQSTLYKRQKINNYFGL